jgi:hypothetical protein
LDGFAGGAGIAVAARLAGVGHAAAALRVTSTSTCAGS